MAVAVHVKFENGDTRLLCYSDNESLSGIEISLKEELLGINGPICDFSVEGSYNWIERLRVYDYAFVFRCFRIQPHVDANYRVD